MYSLPNEIIIEICKFLDNQLLWIISQTCSKINRLCQKLIRERKGELWFLQSNQFESKNLVDIFTKCLYARTEQEAIRKFIRSDNCGVITSLLRIDHYSSIDPKIETLEKDLREKIKTLDDFDDESQEVLDFLKNNEDDLFIFLSHASERIFLCKRFEINKYL